MSTRDEFELVATRLRNIAAALEQFAYPLENRMGPNVLEGGELTDSVYESIKGTRAMAMSLSATVDEYAAEATRRMEEAIAAAKAQSDYESEMADYRESLDYWNRRDELPERTKLVPDEEPTPPPPPPAPPEYVEI